VDLIRTLIVASLDEAVASLDEPNAGCHIQLGANAMTSRLLGVCPTAA